MYLRLCWVLDAICRRSLVVARGPPFTAVRGLFPVVPPLAAGHLLQEHGLSSCHTRSCSAAYGSSPDQD